MSYATPSSDPLAGSTPSNAVQLMQQHGGMLFGLGRRFCGNEDETADLAQETMMEAFKGCGPHSVAAARPQHGCIESPPAYASECTTRWAQEQANFRAMTS